MIQSLSPKRLNIGFDVDGVLVDIVPALNNYHNENYGTSFQKEDYVFYYLDKVWRCTFEEAILRVEQFYMSRHFKDVVPSREVVCGIEKLSKEHDLFVITSRWGPAVKETERWIDTHFPNQFRSVHFSHNKSNIHEQGKKSDICRTLSLDVFVEDHLDYAEECVSEKTDVILVDMPWNQVSSFPSGISRVHSWEGLIKKIEDFKKRPF